MKTYIIAEAGVNHNGDMNVAKELIDFAAAAGADAVKFQTFRTENVVSRYAPKTRYQITTTGNNSTQYQMIKQLELGANDFEELTGYCASRGIEFLSTAFDQDSVDLLNNLGLRIFKIPSGEITNLPYLKKIGSLGKKIMVSTGMADMGEIEDAIDALMDVGTPGENITLLHCNTEYPTPVEDVNLSAMLSIKEAFKLAVGYSDHTLGIEIPVAAVAIGATVIEKHFTIDKNMPGPDHMASLDPHELKEMIKAIRNIEKAMGNGIKKPSRSERRNRVTVRKSIVASRDIKKGEILSEDLLTTKRPGSGISPMDWYNVVGKVASRDFEEDTLIEI